ncbi:MAG: hypothetical protein K2W99_08450 [Chthoniobacterales bacterium]|nr:hypothetical protein [Chthoniobacterales bacterium]
MITPYQARQLSRSDVEVLQELILSKRTFSFSKEKNAQKIRFLKKVVLAKESLSLNIALNINGEKIDLALQATPESSLAHRLLELGGVENIPPEFVTAMQAVCSKEIINAFAHVFEMPVALWKEGDSTSVPTEKCELFFEVIQNNDAIEAQGSITLSPLLLTKLMELAATIPAAQELHFKEVPLVGEVVIGSASISFVDWEKLNVGALIFLREPAPVVTGEATYFLGNNQQIPIVIDLKQAAALITPLAKFSFDSSALPQQKTTEQETLSSTNRPVNIELNFSAGTLSLTIEELLLLTKNKKTNKPITLFRPLKILAQGAYVGAGELVSIHNQHALFVTQLNVL